MTAERSTVKRRPKDRREQILYVARDLFAEHGYRHVSMSQIAERLDVTAGALYRHFPNKGELLAAVVRASYSALTNSDDTDLITAVERGLRQAVESRQTGRIWTRESRNLPEVASLEVREVLRTNLRNFQRLLSAERPDLSEGQTEFLATVIQAMYVVAIETDFEGAAADRMVLALTEILRHVLLSVELAPAEPMDRATQHGLRPAARRELIIAAAAQLFAERGFHETSMADVGKAVDVTGPNLYVYFDDKAALLRTVLERGAHALWDEHWRILARHETAEAALPDVVAGYIERMAGWSPASLRTTGDPEITEMMLAMQRDYQNEWVALLGQVRPELTSRQVARLCRVVLSVIDTISRTPQLRDRTGFHQNLARTARCILLTPLLEEFRIR